MKNTSPTSSTVLVVLASVITLSACSTSTPEATDTTAAQATDFSPVTITNCGFEVTVSTQPQRIITLNQGATETLLALDSQNTMVGTAYLDSEIDPAVQDAYAQIPVLAEKYPTQETVLEKQPDFLVASYASAFDEKNAGSREELAKLGIATYLDPFACPDKTMRAKASWDSITASVQELGELSGHKETAQSLTATIMKAVSKAESNKVAQGKKVFWWDSKTDTPYAGAGHGGPQLLLNTVGAENIFADLEGNWTDVSWEAVLTANPDYIVVADASWDTAESKIAFAKTDPALKELDAVKNDRFITIPFAESTPNVRTYKGIKRLEEGFVK
ncbi:vitamin B12-binding protein [Corynebacterium kutscheri]|uniref:ABC-type Fe3+-hydroxamate transport system, periplasmic component n=1 Tax=Corynebacterium kutscheri TaxID=35755 RepID=A0A0F6QZF1_9CORY|nr:ABC transporter substrate-binding protein [Corynebacterium kutscheri]AKE41117.1 ABC-type Fe3+-hydroxamate transport system, periplasmic component [Corynebacterium kutscheri]VEH07025.1 vitamin B12-binding protein [Corynebacterium kutscheri]VEH09435.1 vitamin B12-binding protein [Corynebacterium kutscheri]VEH79521.1 vitamin B12-binding protein [Corynebacterium kutscheri]